MKFEELIRSRLLWYNVQTQSDESQSYHDERTSRPTHDRIIGNP